MGMREFAFSSRGLPGLFLVASLLLIGCATHRVSMAPSSSEAVIQDVSGGAEISTGANSWSKAQPGSTLHTGSRVKTGPNGTVTVNLGSNGGSVDVMPGSLVEIERLGATRTEPEVVAILNLLEGRVVGDTKTPPSHGKILVRTRGGTYEVR